MPDIASQLSEMSKTLMENNTKMIAALKVTEPMQITKSRSKYGIVFMKEGEKAAPPPLVSHPSLANMHTADLVSASEAFVPSILKAVGNYNGISTKIGDTSVKQALDTAVASATKATQHLMDSLKLLKGLR